MLYIWEHMKFHRNFFHPLRLILYPLLIAIVLMVNQTITSEAFWAVYILLTLLLWCEAIWEIATPYIVFDGTVFEIKDNVFTKRRIDLSQHHDSKIVIAAWHIQIGDEYINLRKVGRGYRDRLAETIQNYFEPPAPEQDNT